MSARALSLPGLWSFSPDDEPDGGTAAAAGPAYDLASVGDAVGHPLEIGHLHHAQGLRGVLHGPRFSVEDWTYLTCARGAVLVLVVDVRTGSPTTGRHEALELRAGDGRGVYVSPGLAHGFTALEDDSVLTHLGPRGHRPEKDRAVHALDPTLRLPWPQAGVDGAPAPSLPPEGANAPLLADLRKAKRVPTYVSPRS